MLLQIAAESTSDGGSWLFGFFPRIDGQTAFSIILGSILTFGTFWIGYRKTIGAADERLRSANIDLCNSVVRRIAVERAKMTHDQFSALRRAKSFRSQVSINRLMNFNDALDYSMLEIMDNDFLDSPSKDIIINLITDSRNSQSSHEEKSNTRVIGEKSAYFVVSTLGIVSAAVGIVTAFATTIADKGSSSIGAMSDGKLTLQFIVNAIPVVLVLAYILMSLIDKIKDANNMNIYRTKEKERFDEMRRKYVKKEEKVDI